MPIEVKWDNNEKTLIRWNFMGRWTAQQLRETIQKSNDWINAQDHTVNHIIDLSQTEGVPPNIINEARNAMRLMPENLGHVVMIGKGGIIELLGTTLQRFSWFSDKIHFVRSNAEAHNYINSL